MSRAECGSTLERRLTTAPQISSAVAEERRVVLHREHLLAAVRVILPHRLDGRLEQVVVRVALQFGWRLQPVEVPAILYDSTVSKSPTVIKPAS